MSKHLNKEWLKEKEYRSLREESSYLYDILPRYSTYRMVPNSRTVEVQNKIRNKFYNRDRVGNTPPKWYRKMLNSKQKTKSKRELYNTINNSKDFLSEDNYRGAHWSYW